MIVQCSPEQDVLLIAQVERHGVNGNIGRAFISGFGLKSGAIASSIGHDNHNIIVVGTNPADMAFAVNQVAEMEGGQVVVKKGKVLASIPFHAVTDCGFIDVLSGKVIDPVIG